MELIQVAPRTYYVDIPAKVGVYRISDTEVWFIDSGNDKDAARKLANKVLAPRGWTLKGIAVTHSHADHIGGCAELKKRTGCLVCSEGIEKCVTENTILEPTTLYGGYPMKAWQNKFLKAPECTVDGGWELLPDGLEPTELKGHAYDMYGFRTSDGVVFLADSLVSAQTLEKYHVSFVADPKGFLETLSKIEAMEASLFIPSHAAPEQDITPLVKLNRGKTVEILDILKASSAGGKCWDDLLKAVFDHYGLTLDMSQYVLSGSTIRSYLSYLCDMGEMSCAIEDNRLLFQATASPDTCAY